MAVPSAMVGVMVVGTACVGALHEGGGDRSAIGRLGGEDAGQRLRLAGAQQFGEADLAAQHVGARAAGDDDVVGDAETEILPQLIGQGFRAVQEERVPVVTGVEDRAGPGDGGVGGVLTGAGDEFHRRAMGAHLHRLGRAGGVRRHDRRGDTSGGGIGGDRGAAVAGAILQHMVNALGAQQRQHHTRAAILEAAGWVEPLALQQHAHPGDGAGHQRGDALAKADWVVDGEREGGPVAPQAAL